MAACIYLVVFGLSQLIGSNDMFVAHKPGTASLLAIEGIAAGMFGLLYLPVIPRKSDKPTATH